MQYSNQNKITNIKKINKKYNETSDAVIYLDVAYGEDMQSSGPCDNSGNGCTGSCNHSSGIK
jgi:hypothetical protein